MTAVALIWAMAENNVIGQDNAMPWHLPADMRWFRQHTLGRPVIMGRKTFHSLGDRPLPDRPNIVVSGDTSYRPEGVTVAASPALALTAVENESEWAMVIGGAQLYAAFLPMASRLIVTRIHVEIEGDAHFPRVDWRYWERVEQQEHPADDENPYAMSFEVYDYHVPQRR
jgi:dihydrofolate reductase